MCQLTFVALNDLKLAQLYLSVQSPINSVTTHQDGFGFFTEKDGIFKSQVASVHATDFGYVINNHVNSLPIISHVRNASMTNGAKIITRENSHPFETDKLVLAHNGSLELIKLEDMKKEEFKGMIDSQIFLQCLSNNYTENLSFVEAIENTMKDFHGKFAFLIFDKITHRYYVIRGGTANLFLYSFISEDGKDYGFVVNTEKDSLIRGIMLFNNIVELTHGIKFRYVDKQLVELNKETIYEFDENIIDLRKVKELKENTKSYQKSFRDDTHYNNWWDKNREKTNDNSLISKISKELQEFLLEFEFTIWDLDLLCLEMLGCPLLGCTSSDLDIFTDKVIPILRSYHHKNKVREWKKIKELMITYNSVSVCNKLELKFPYIVNDIKELRTVRQRLQDEEYERKHKETKSAS